MASTTDREGEERPVSAPQTPTHNPTVSSPRASSPDIITPVSPSHTYSLFQDNTYIEYDTLPDSLDEWTKAAIQHKQVGGSIFNLDKFASASKITHKQFLHLRVLWTENKAIVLANDNIRRRWLRDEHYLEARRLLAEFPAWNAYLDSLEVSLDNPQNAPPANLGIFSLVQCNQLRAKASPEEKNFQPKFSPIAHRTRSKFRIRLADA